MAVNSLKKKKKILWKFLAADSSRFLIVSYNNFYNNRVNVSLVRATRLGFEKRICSSGVILWEREERYNDIFLHTSVQFATFNRRREFWLFLFRLVHCRRPSTFVARFDALNYRLPPLFRSFFFFFFSWFVRKILLILLIQD